MVSRTPGGVVQVGVVLVQQPHQPNVAKRRGSKQRSLPTPVVSSVGPRCQEGANAGDTVEDNGSVEQGHVAELLVRSWDLRKIEVVVILRPDFTSRSLNSSPSCPSMSKSSPRIHVMGAFNISRAGGPACVDAVY